MQGTVVSFEVQPGDEVYVGKLVLVMEAMKMEHEVRAEVSGIVERLGIEPGDTIFEGHPLIILQSAEVAVGDEGEKEELDLDYIRPDLQEVTDRKGAGLDANRPEAVAKRHKTGRRTARENIAHLCDEGTFVEYGSGSCGGPAAQTFHGRSDQEHYWRWHGCGVGADKWRSVPEAAVALVMSYDYMVLAGTQGMKNHDKSDRLLQLLSNNVYQRSYLLKAVAVLAQTQTALVAGLTAWPLPISHGFQAWCR